ncbi:hypothetical protein BpHYR1_021009 [Brachionus plicatilis]|uniref:Uncharacterized protein n=1 Tax=Brachionus plicatilis TaxID=10195 RepID=A0A3M7T150_BRAPC|nr:hypothetical protein BpHYR1_021009 [Brachionus plicatilis]
MFFFDALVRRFFSIFVFIKCT